MKPIRYIERTSGKVLEEQVFGEKALHFLYSDTVLAKILRPLITKLPLFSAFYGFLQKMPWTKSKAKKFIENFNLDTSEFEKQEFDSFNDFFVRKLKPKARPISDAPFIIPADGRYLFYDKIEEFTVKGERFSLSTLLEDEELVSKYKEGSMAIARLCPVDYHRFHFPIDCTPSPARLINGWLYSVNPVALKRDIQIFSKNKRAITHLDNILFLEIGATCVGSIQQTYSPNTPTKKGHEKGTFSFGASALILLFPKNSITFSPDLLEATKQGLEIRCLMGQEMGSKK